MIYLKCIDSGGYHLTPGKIYSATIFYITSEFFPDKTIFDYYITNDRGFLHGVESELFINVSELRDKKLNELGI
jgi:hypothetical protein